MTDVNLTQIEADNLIKMEKHRSDDNQYNFPISGESLTLQLQSPDKRENFFLDLRRGRIDLLKGTYQNRSRQVIVLVRLDFGGPSHRNPDGEEIPGPHLHQYREGYGDKWAKPAPLEIFTSLFDLWITLVEFMNYCNITRPPKIERSLFS